MKKTEIDYFRNRITETVQCTNGEISTRLRKYRKLETLTVADKLALIREGRATLLPDYDLANKSSYGDRQSTVVADCFTYGLTPKQLAAQEYTQTIKNKEQELHTEVELEGKRLLDRMVLGLVTADQVADELKVLGEMVSLAVMGK